MIAIMSISNKTTADNDKSSCVEGLLDVRAAYDHIRLWCRVSDRETTTILGKLGRAMEEHDHQL